MPRITIAQVAAAAGVSIATTSKALNGTDSISPDTIRRVTETAERLGYRPNRAAQLLAGKNKHIGILIPTSPEPVFNLFEQGARDAMSELEEFGFRSTLIRHGALDDVEAFSAALASLEGKVHGLIFCGNIHIRPFADHLRTLRIPKVALQNALVPLNSAAASVPPCVMVDAPCVGRMAAQYLALTCKNAAVIVGEVGQYIHGKNIEGFLAEAAQRSLAVTEILESFDDFATTRVLTEKLTDSNPPDGIFVSSYVAPAVCAVLRERGLAGRVKVIGVDIWEQSAGCLQDGSLDAVIFQNQPLQARRAVEMLASMMHEGTGEKPANIYIKPELVMESWLHHYF